MQAPRPETRTPSPEIALAPIANPSVLGIFAFSGSLVLVGPWYAGWYGTPHSPFYLAPFVLTFGGFAQLTAAMFALRARQWLTVAISGVWATQHLAWGVLYLLYAAHAIPAPPLNAPSPGEAAWYVPLALFTLTAAIPAARLNAMSVATAVLGGTGAALGAISYGIGSKSIGIVSGYVLLATAAVGLYAATALLLKDAYGRPILPVGQAKAAQELPEVDPGEGEPGVTRGQ